MRKWHDGKPFTSADVKCTWDMLTGKSETQKLRKNPRTSWYWNLQEVTTNGDREVTFHLGQPQPSLLILLASGYSPVYPCHVPTAQMRTKPIGTGPFKLGEFKQKEIVKLVRNPDYFKKGKPYLDGIDMPIVPARGTAMLGFVAGRYDMTFALRRHHPAAQGHQGAGNQCRLRGRADEQQHQPDRQPHGTAVRQCRHPPRDAR